MRKFLDKLVEFIAFIKVSMMSLGALYLIFWFYRFFNLPYNDLMAAFFDFPNNLFPWPIETMSVYKGHIVQNAYFVDGIICAILSYIFSLVEKIGYEVQRKYEISNLKQKRKMEEDMNKELKRSYMADLYRYDYFSLLIKYKVKYISEVLSINNPYTPENMLKRSYDTTFDYLKKNLPTLKILQNTNYIYIYGGGFNNFEMVITKVLDCIKGIKKNNGSAYMNTDFLIAGDAHTSENIALEALSELEKTANSEYYNRAIMTAAFKARFDLLNSQKFIVDILGFSSGGRKDSANDKDIYILKSKPKPV